MAAVDVLEEKVQPLSQTKSGRVESEQERPVLGVDDGVEEGADFAASLFPKEVTPDICGTIAL